MLELKINNETIQVEKGIKAFDLIKNREDAKKIYAIMLNGKLHDLNYLIKQSGDVAFIYKNSETGRQIYYRSLFFLFIGAVHRCFPNANVRIEHSLSGGQYCELDMKKYLTIEDVDKIHEEMKKMVNENIAIKRDVIPTDKAIAYFDEKEMHEKAELLRIRKSQTSSLYQLDGVEDYFYGIMLPNTSYIQYFSLRYYAPGLWLSPQTVFVDQPKLFHVFQEFEHWGKRIGVSNVAQLNQKINEGAMNELVLMCETMIEKNLTEMSTKIINEFPHTKFILIAGPSSVGKTTFSRRLAIHLKILGKTPLTISMDDFYKNREDTPKLADGSYDFDGIDAIDLALFDRVMLNLIHGEALHMPKYNFKKGLREWHEKEITLEQDGIVIIEGIHGLNPKICAYMPNEATFKIYINALTHLNLDNHNPIPTRDYRLIRRIVRDYQFRGWGGDETIQSWNNVCKGEDINIYPYQEEADYIFNSSMVYEMPILKKIASPQLNKITMDMPQFLEAQRLKKLLSYFVDGDIDAMPRHSILAEFVGNSIFDL